LQYPSPNSTWAWRHCSTNQTINWITPDTNMSEKNIKQATPKQTENKKTTTKAAVKKTVVKKKASNKKKAVTSSTAIDPNIKSIVEEMNNQRETRDKQISSLIEEVRDGFTTASKISNKQDKEHQKEMTGLYQTLQKTFGQIKNDSTENETLNLNLFKSLSDSMMSDHEQTLEEIKEQGKLQDKKIAHMTSMMEQRTGRNRLIAIPGVILAVVGVIYMFYVVSVMENAMTNMSTNMHLMQLDVGSMSDNIGDMSGNISTISQDTSSMSGNMQKLNGNVGHMSKDLNVLTRNVAPAMKGMRNVMPWAP